MKNTMKNYSINRFVNWSIVKRTLAVAGMTMGLALGAKAEDRPMTTLFCSDGGLLEQEDRRITWTNHVYTGGKIIEGKQGLPCPVYQEEKVITVSYLTWGYLFSSGRTEYTNETVAVGAEMDLSLKEKIYEAEAYIQGTQYLTVKDALAVSATASPYLMRNVSVGEDLTVGAAQTLTADGYVITNEAGVVFTVQGTITFQNSIVSELVNNGTFVVESGGKVKVGSKEVVGGNDATFITTFEGSVLTFSNKNCTVTGWIWAKGVGDHGHKFILGDADANTKIMADQNQVPAASIDLAENLKQDYVVAFEQGCYFAKKAMSAIEYLAPVYKEVGGTVSPTNGVERWETLTNRLYTVVESATATVTWNAGWYVVTNDVTLSQGAKCSGAAHLILKDGCSLTVQGDEDCAGITVSGDGNSLTIYGQNAGTGKLEATGGDNGAGIGGGYKGAGSNITINGGTVTATGGSGGAGIGGGSGGDGNGSDITINGGTVTATSPSRGGAGIGGGKYNAGSNITINGGTVTATSEQGGAGIGGGDEGAGSNITINGGTVTATALYDGAAAIGSGDNSENPATNIKVNLLLVLKADNSNPPTTVIANTGADLANALKNQRYATVEPPKPAKVTVTDVANADWVAYTNDVPLTGEQPYTVEGGEIVKVAYTAKDGYMFPGGYKTLTTNVAASAETVMVTLSAEQQPVDAVACTNCITFSAAEDFGIRMNKGQGKGEKEPVALDVNLEYSTDQIYWQTFNADTDYAAGEDHKLYLRGKNNKTFASGSGKASCNIFTNTADSVATAIACSGNIETLLDYTTVAAGDHPPTDTCTFDCLFLRFAALTTAPELPATNLQTCCYCGMFQGCSLTVAPKLPATTMKMQCYNSMFSDCTSLTTAPELPATNLAMMCYCQMFQNCTSLVVNTNAPGKAWSIPAEASSTASASSWNLNMFKGTPGDITNATVTCGTPYYVASAPVTLYVAAVDNATFQAYTNDAPVDVPCTINYIIPVKVVYTATPGYAFPDGKTEFTTNITERAETVTVTLPKEQWPIPLPPVKFEVSAPDGATAAVYTNDVRVTGGTVVSNSIAHVVYTVSEAGKFFENGETAVTNTLDTTTNPAVDRSAYVPTKADTPKVQLGIVAQRYPWNGWLDIGYKTFFANSSVIVTFFANDIELGTAQGTGGEAATASFDLNAVDAFKDKAIKSVRITAEIK